jgi:hypothetical protein
LRERVVPHDARAGRYVVRLEPRSAVPAGIGIEKPDVVLEAVPGGGSRALASEYVNSGGGSGARHSDTERGVVLSLVLVWGIYGGRLVSYLHNAIVGNRTVTRFLIE